MNAGGDDFSTNVTDITFSADEGMDLDLNRNVDISIVNDNIDEAEREYFILYLSLVDEPLQGLRLSTTISVGGIDDDDSKSWLSLNKVGKLLWGKCPMPKRDEGPITQRS